MTPAAAPASPRASAPGCEAANASPCAWLARRAIRALWDELALSPKPGLVSLEDPGAHDDMDARTFVRSLVALRPHFAALADAGARNATFAELREIGVGAEQSMLAATGGVNTHRGAIFVVGLLCAAAARTAAQGGAFVDAILRQALRSSWGDALDAHVPASGVAPSHGALAARRHGAGGARSEARAAFPAVFDVALPALRAARERGSGERHARLAALFALLAEVEDTNVLHRGGAAGLAFVRERARELRRAADLTGAARAFHAELVARRLSPGGCADLLAAAIFVDSLQAGAA